MRGAFVSVSVVFGVFACFVAACATAEPGYQPSWVAPEVLALAEHGSGVYGEVIRGVGASAPGLPPALGRTQARNRARAELSKLVAVMTSATYKDFGCATLECEPTEDGKQLAAAASRAKDVTGEVVSTATIAGDSYDVRARAWWSIATVSRERWISAIVATGDSEKLRAVLRRRAERTFEDMAAEEQR